MKTDVVVIGGGVIGLVSAWRLAQKGLRATVVEKDICGGGASTATLGALMPYNPSRQDPLPTLQRESLGLFPAFTREIATLTGVDIGYAPCGRLQPIQSDHQLARNREAAELAAELWPHTTEGKPALEILSPEQTRQLEPALRVGPQGALLCHVSAKVDPTGLVKGLKEACLKNGVTFMEHTTVSSLLLRSGTCGGVVTNGGLVEAPRTVLAAGAWTAGLLPNAPHVAAITPVKGQALKLRVREQPLRKSFIRALSVYVIPAGAHHVLVGASKEPEAGFDLTLRPEITKKMVAKAVQLVPALAEATVEEEWAGLRPGSREKAPFIGPVAGVKGVYMAAGHGGIGLCMTPITGQLVASAITA